MTATAVRPDTALLAVEGVTKYYGEGGKRILVLREVSLQVHAEEIIAILGPSGSGKSTLLRILAGLVAPSEGSVRFRGEPQTGPNPHIAIVFQTFALFPWLSVYQNVELGLLTSGVPETQRRRRILEAIDMIGLDGFEDAYPRELSGGMRQRVGFARALVVQPALDVLTAENLKRELLGLWRSRRIPTRAIVMVTHNIDEAVMLGDRIVVMGSNPGTIRVDMHGLPVAERGKERPEHGRLVDYLYNVITNPTAAVPPFRPEAPPARPAAMPERPFQVLPHVAVGQVTGLVEHLHADQDRADLPALGRELQLEVDDLLPLVQAIELLGLGHTDAGDVYLTPAGIRFAEAGVQEEKVVFREQARERIELLRLILRLLDNQPRGRLREEEVLTALEGSFTPEEARRQLETATDWGRYAELFSYDDSEGVFYREAEEAEVR
jgi:NitT/TauT family transport system ATP-binding protein